MAWLALNRAEAMNAHSERVLDDLAAHLADIEDERDVCVVVVTGTGRAFCAGADLKEVLGPDGKVDPARLLAFEMGLVNEVVPADQLVMRAEELDTTIARRSPSALRLFKQAIDDGPDQPLVTAEHLHSGDVDEGLRAFAEKRASLFKTTSGGTR